MRTKNDLTYQEHKENILNDFCLWKKNPSVWTPKMCTDKLIDDMYEYSDEEPMLGASRFLFFVALGEYEIRHSILEDRNLIALSYHIYRYENMGRYKADLTPEEIEEVEKDIAYIKSKVELPELNTYEDFE